MTYRFKNSKVLLSASDAEGVLTVVFAANKAEYTYTPGPGCAAAPTQAVCDLMRADAEPEGAIRFFNQHIKPFFICRRQEERTKP
jgi:hypothetical protein